MKSLLTYISVLLCMYLFLLCGHGKIYFDSHSIVFWIHLWRKLECHIIICLATEWQLNVWSATIASVDSVTMPDITAPNAQQWLSPQQMCELSENALRFYLTKLIWLGKKNNKKLESEVKEKTRMFTNLNLKYNDLLKKKQKRRKSSSHNNNASNPQTSMNVMPQSQSNPYSQTQTIAETVFTDNNATFNNNNMRRKQRQSQPLMQPIQNVSYPWHQRQNSQQTMYDLNINNTV